MKEPLTLRNPLKEGKKAKTPPPLPAALVPDTDKASVQLTPPCTMRLMAPPLPPVAEAVTAPCMLPLTAHATVELTNTAPPPRDDDTCVKVEDETFTDAHTSASVGEVPTILMPKAPPEPPVALVFKNVHDDTESDAPALDSETFTTALNAPPSLFREATFAMVTLLSDTMTALGSHTAPITPACAKRVNDE